MNLYTVSICRETVFNRGDFAC